MPSIVTESITVKFVNPAKDGFKFASLKLADDTFISVRPEDLGLFSKGGTYAVDIELSDKMDKYGNPYRMVKKLAGGTAPAQRGPTPQPMSQTMPQGNQAEEIFVTGIVGRAMGSGQFQIEDIVSLTQAATQAWRSRNGNIAATPKYDTGSGGNHIDMPDDPIPF